MEIELGIYEDCLDLIEKFVENNNPTFESFCQQWQNATFQHIYAVQTTAIEVIQTTKTILHLAKRIVCGKDELGRLAVEQNNRAIFRRIGAIYLLYAVYFKQPTKNYVKLLVSYETWKDLLTFLESLPKADMANEVQYMFWHLYKEDAFRFTALDYDVGLENLVDYDGLYDLHNGIKSEEVVRAKLKQKLMSVADTTKDLPNMVALEEKYNKKKESLVTNDKSAKALPPTKIFQSIHDALKSILDVLDEKDIQRKSPTKSGSNYEEKRKQLKRKASGRYDYLANDEELEEDIIPQQEEKKNHFGRSTVRLIMTQKLPERITDDLKNSSTEDEDNSEIQESSNLEQFGSDTENNT